MTTNKTSVAALKRRIIEAAIEWNGKPKEHTSDCGCRLCVELAVAVEALLDALERKKEPR